MKTVIRKEYAKTIVVSLAALASLWAVSTTLIHFMMGRMIFVNFALPRQSLKAFLNETPEQVIDDVMTAHERGLYMLASPLISAAILWLGAYVITEWQRKGEAKGREQAGSGYPPHGVGSPDP